MPTYGLLLNGAVVIDGLRAPRFISDVAIANGRIARIGGIADSESARVIDASDLIVYDYDALEVLPTERLYDFPAGDWRLAHQGMVHGFHSDESAEARNRHACKHIMAYSEESGGMMSPDPLRLHLYG